MYITKTIKITVHATAGDWQLYDLPGRDDVAIALNQRFEALVNKGAMRSEVRNGMPLSGYANLGAADTEVRDFVEDLLDRTFNDERRAITNNAPTIRAPSRC